MTHSSQKKSKSKERSVSASLKSRKRPKGKNRDRGVSSESLKPTEQQKKSKTIKTQQQIGIYYL